MSANDATEFKAFPKIARYNRPFIVTEKIDGTNASVWVVDETSALKDRAVATVGELSVLAGSRNRFLSVGSDNFGFARWVTEHAEELTQLGLGAHYGEWWGSGIQRGYGLQEKRFSLFNTTRWGDERPACCHVVPVIDVLMPHEIVCERVKEAMLQVGSLAAPGYMRPEGFVAFHEKSNALFKYTFDDDGHKGEARR